MAALLALLIVAAWIAGGYFAVRALLRPRGRWERVAGGVYMAGATVVFLAAALG